MEQLLIYLLKGSALLSIFWIAYQLLLRNDTCFQTNRGFLLAGILGSLLLPMAEFTRIVPAEVQARPLNFETSVLLNDFSTTPERSIDWWQVGGIIYFLGLTFFLLRLLFQVISLFRIFKEGTKTKEGKNLLVLSQRQLTPFSFFRFIVVNPDLHSEEELKMVLQHEKVHASQWHTADVLGSNLAAAVLWFNPLSWWYKRSLVQNLEYLADRETVAAAVPKKEYQHTLVKFSVACYQPALANNFYQSLIKKRIIMLNKKPTQKLSYLKIGAVIPFICAFMFFFNVRTQAQVARIQVSSVQDEHQLSAIINKNTSEEALETIAEMFEEEGVNLSFETEYSANTLIKIDIFHNSGEAGFYSADGLADIRIALKGENFSIEEVSPDPRFFKDIGNAPLFFINNKQYKTTDLEGKTVQILEGFSLLSKKEALEKFGESAKDGVITIREGKIIDDIQTALNEIDSKDLPVKQYYITVHSGEKPAFVEVEKTSNKEALTGSIIPDTEDINASSSKGTVVLNEKILKDKDILYVLNGKIMDASFKADEVKAENIESIHVLKGKSGIEKYGEKARDGVIEIITKEKG